MKYLFILAAVSLLLFSFGCASSQPNPSASQASASPAAQPVPLDAVKQQSLISQSSSYWRGEAKPFAIVSYSVSSGGIGKIKIQNLESSSPKLTINRLVVGGIAVSPDIDLSPGEMKEFQIEGLQTGASGSLYQFDASITYSQTDGTSSTQTGEKKLVGRYS